MEQNGILPHKFFKIEKSIFLTARNLYRTISKRESIYTKEIFIKHKEFTYDEITNALSFLYVVGAIKYDDSGDEGKIIK